MNAAVDSVVVDHYVFITTLVVLLVSACGLFVVILWRRRPHADEGAAVDDEFFMEDAQPRSKKAVKSKPKKNQSQKAWCFLLFIDVY